MASPLVVDISHFESVTDFAAVFRAGIRGMIHKATQGTSYVDPEYHERLEPSRSAGILYGGYHFADASPVSKQVDHFLSTVRPDLNPGLLLALDLEENTPRRGGTMQLDEAKEFLRLVYRQTGQWPVLYSGNLLKQYLKGKADKDLATIRLWLAQYGARAVLPPGWDGYFLHQYTGDGHGPGQHTVPGIKVDGPNQGLDLNYFGGADLGKEWALGTYVHDTPLVTVPSIAVKAPPAPVAFVDAPTDPTVASKWDLIAASRRLTLGRRMQNFYKATGGVSAISFALFQQVRDFVTDWRSLAILLIGGLSWAAFKMMESQSVTEAEDGRYTPSGMAEKS